MPASRASRSTIASRATDSSIHGPRYAPRPQVFVHTDVLTHPMRGIRYGPGKSIDAYGPVPPVPPTGHAPAVLDVVEPGAEQAAVGVERRASTVTASARAWLAAMRFSRRSSIHFTGRPRRWAAATTASSSRWQKYFWPKPPPTSPICTRTSVLGHTEHP